MKKFLIAIFIFNSSAIFSQTKITGVMTDTLEVPIPFAAVGLFLLPDSNLVKGTITDELGNYSLDKINIGHYILKISISGYQEKIIQNIVVDSSSNRDLKLNIRLSQALYTFGEVSVTAIRRTIEFKNGNVVVNVENSPLAQGNSVFDLLAKLPGVSVDDNKITIQGKTGVVVLIDNRPQTLSNDQLINLLKSMNADLISKIEIFKNPPVRYDASGTAGMINITSKKVKVLGITGTAFSSYSQGFYEHISSGGSLNYKSNKIVFYSTVNGDYGHYRRLELLNKKFISDETDMQFNNTIKIKETNLNYKAGIDLLPTGKDVIGFKVEGGPGKNTSSANGRNVISGYNNLGLNHIESMSTQPDQWNTISFNINYDHKIDTLGSLLSIVTDYADLKENIFSQNSNQFYNQFDTQILSPNNYRSNNLGRSNILALRADLVKIIDSHSSFETGVKVANTSISNDYLFETESTNSGTYLKDTNISNKFRYTEINYAGYFNYIKSIKKWNIYLGFRLEKTSLTGESDKKFKINKEYFNIFKSSIFSEKNGMK